MVNYLDCIHELASIPELAITFIIMHLSIVGPTIPTGAEGGECWGFDLSHRSWSPATAGPPDQVWLPWMVRFAASDPPLANRLKVDKTVAGIPTERSDCLVKAPCMLVAMAN